MTHSPIFIYSRMASDIRLMTTEIMGEDTHYHHTTVHFLQLDNQEGKEGNVLFNYFYFYLQLYIIRHMVKDHSDSEREKPHCCHIMSYFLLAARDLLYASERIALSWPLLRQ